MCSSDLIHIVDLDGAREGTPTQSTVVARIVGAMGEQVRCEVAGGLRTEGAVEEALAAGAARVVVGTAALRDPGFAAAVIERHGPDRIVIALDIRDGLALGDGWLPGAAGVGAEDALRGLAAGGARIFAATAIDRDGLLAGPDLALLSRLVRLQSGDIVASGGVTTLDDLRRVQAIGCTGAIVGRAIYEGHLDLAAAIAAVDRLG